MLKVDAVSPTMMSVTNYLFLFYDWLVSLPLNFSCLWQVVKLKFWARGPRTLICA